MHSVAIFCKFEIKLSPELKGDGPRKEVHTRRDIGQLQGGEDQQGKEG